MAVANGANGIAAAIPNQNIGNQVAAYGGATGNAVQYGMTNQDAMGGVMQGLGGVAAIAGNGGQPLANNGAQNVNAAAAYNQANQALQAGNAVVVQMAPGTAVNAIQQIANIPGVTTVTYVP